MTLSVTRNLSEGRPSPGRTGPARVGTPTPYWTRSLPCGWHGDMGRLKDAPSATTLSPVPTLPPVTVTAISTLQGGQPDPAPAC